MSARAKAKAKATPSQPPLSERRMKAAQAVPELPPATITLNVEELSDWREWLEATPDQVVTIFSAIEQLVESVNAYARALNQTRGFDDNVRDRYEEAECLRNAALKNLRFIATAEKEMATRIGELLLRNAVRRREVPNEGA